MAEPDSEVLSYQSGGSIFRAYNVLMEIAAKREDLEALVLLHQDAEIIDPGFCAKIRAALAANNICCLGKRRLSGSERMPASAAKSSEPCSAAETCARHALCSGSSSPPRKLKF